MSKEQGAGTSVPSNESRDNGTKVPTPKGYKQTKVGVIPEEWEVVKLGDIAPNISYGLTVRPKYIENGIPLISATEIKNGTIDYSNAPNISKDDFNKLSQKAKAKKGDIFLSKTGTVGRVAYVSIDEIIAITQNIAIIRTDSKKYSHEFLLQYLITDNFQKSAIKKVNQSTIMDLQLQDIKKLIIPLPPLKEQQKIAKILTTWDDAISRQEALIKAKEQLKKGLMQKLLSGEVRFAGFDDEWEEVKLGDVANIIMGQSPSSCSYNENKEGVPLIQGNADCKNRKTSPRAYTTEKTKVCKVNDIIMTVRAPVGAISKSYHNACIGRGVCAIRSKEENDFLYHYLVMYEEKWEKYSQGSTFTAVNSGDIKNLKIKLPPLQEQQKIAQILTTADKEIELLKNELEVLKEQKRGLMQRLLSGEVRTHKIEERE